ncbi:MAG: DUF1015 domain-containing protein [Clostridia bacterium]
MNCIKTSNILFPKKEINLEKWAVIACDQYTSQPNYWKEVLETVQDVPSTYNITLPEIYLEDDDMLEKTKIIHQNMKNYINSGILSTLPEGIVLVKRYTSDKNPRRGVVLEIDLECYDFSPSSTSPIRPTEKTIVERIPPRLVIRRDADLETPHVMLLIDDPAREIIEPLFEKPQVCIYDFDLMQNGGHISGYFVEKGEKTDEFFSKINSLFNEKTFCEKYNLEFKKYPTLPFAVGDGNHSLATAKSHWLDVKHGLTDFEQENHPARFCLVEIVNIHEESLIIEPIHRVLFNVDIPRFTDYSKTFFEKNGCKTELLSEKPLHIKDSHIFPIITNKTTQYLVVSNPKWAIPIATLQNLLDDFMSIEKQCKLDYIHGEDVVLELAKNDKTIGFILPDIEKGDIFKGVILDGVLPRKTFSMGEAHEKRYYIESRKITL